MGRTVWQTAPREPTYKHPNLLAFSRNPTSLKAVDSVSPAFSDSALTPVMNGLFPHFHVGLIIPDMVGYNGFTPLTRGSPHRGRD